MTLAVLFSRALQGMQAPEVMVEVHLANGLPAFQIVGLPETEVKESRDRVRAAIQTSGFEFPARKITVSLAPADLPKASCRFDLPIALGILAASGQVAAECLARYEFAGELALSGSLRPVRGALAMAWEARHAGRVLVLPPQSAQEAAHSAVTVLQADSLLQVCAHLNGRTALPSAHPSDAEHLDAGPDLSDVRGQAAARHALELAAAGGHSLLLLGPPGTGKSMLAARLPGILPPLSDEEALESAALQSLGPQGFDARAWRRRPFRAPHHASSVAALIGGGSGVPRPGEISLAHHGVLFLDEMPEFERRALEALREPLETGVVHLSRATARVCYPARFQLVAAMNPCPCGYAGDQSGRCQCTPEQISRYRGKISGPLLDRIDMQVDMATHSAAELFGAAAGEGSHEVRLRVLAARARQLVRQGKINALLTVGELERFCPVESGLLVFLAELLARLHLSARAVHRILRLALTIADVSAADRVGKSQVLQAVQLRRQAFARQ